MEGQHGGKRPGAGRKPAGTEPTSPAEAFAKARAEKERALADIRTMEADKLRGRLVDIEEVGQAWTQIIRGVRDRFLHLGTRLSPEVTPLTDMREVEQIIDREVYAILEELAEAGFLDEEK